VPLQAGCWSAVGLPSGLRPKCPPHDVFQAGRLRGPRPAPGMAAAVCLLNAAKPGCGWGGTNVRHTYAILGLPDPETRLLTLRLEQELHEACGKERKQSVSRSVARGAG